MVLENGCGVGMYVQHLSREGGRVFGLEYDFERAAEAGRQAADHYAAGEYLPYPTATFDLILSHEVLEHVADDVLAAHEMARVLKPGGRVVILSPIVDILLKPTASTGRINYFGNKLLLIIAAALAQPLGAACAHLFSFRPGKIVCGYTGQDR